MPAANPVASTPGVPQSKSFRSRLGFGGSGGAPSKPSFFSLKPGRKSLGSSGDLKGQEQPVLLIDAHPEHGRAPHENHVVLNEDDARNQLSRTPQSSEIPIKDLPSRPKRNIINRSQSASPAQSDRHNHDFQIAQGGFQSSSTNGAGSNFDPNHSGLSKQLPELSADLSLLMNEPPPDTVSQSDLHESRTSHSGSQGPIVGSYKGKARERYNVQEPAASMNDARPVSSSPPRGPQASESTMSRLPMDAVEDASASFDLSGAKLSLNFMRQSLGDEWAKSAVEDSVAPSVETNVLLSPPVSSFAESGSGLITSTPFRSPSESPPRPQSEDVSFNLDALDPDLVALLRPNSFNHGSSQVNRVVTPSPLEPFSPPPDPLNPDTTAKGAPEPPSSLSSPNDTRNDPDGIAKSSLRKYATLTGSSSPVRPLRLARSRTAQELPPHVSNHITVDDRLDLQRPPSHARSDGRQAFSMAASSSDAGTPLDASKQPSPLSAAPLTLGDLERHREPSPAQSSAASTSTPNINNVTTRRRLRTGATLQAPAPRPASALASSTEARPVARYSYQDRDRELRQTSASPPPSSSGLSTYVSGSLGRDRDRVRPSLDGLFHERFSSLERPMGRSNSVSGGDAHNLPHINGAFPRARDRDRDFSADRRYRKRSMSLDQHPGGMGPRNTPEDPQRSGHTTSRFRPMGEGGRGMEWAGSEGSEYGHVTRVGLDVPFDGRYRDIDRNHYDRYGYAYGDRERPIRTQTDWLGPRTAKAFAAAGLLDDSRESSAFRYGAFIRSTSERDIRAVGTGPGRERGRWSPIIGGTQLDGDRDKGYHKFASSVRDRDFVSSGIRAGTETPSTSSATRPSSRGEPSSYTRQAPLFARPMSDVTSQRGSADGRDGLHTTHYRQGSAYSPGGGESAGSGGGRASPTTTSSLVIVQSQLQSLKDKHDTQTEALLAALADSQKTARGLKEENEALKGELRALEERLAETIANARQKEKDLVRAISVRTRPQSPDRTHLVRSRPPPPPSSKVSPRSSSPKKRRLSTSSIFPTVPASMALLMAETPGSPPQGSVGSTGESRAPSPTLVLPSKQKARDTDGDRASQPIQISHKRSTSGVSMATSANFSFETGSPGSLRLKPEHELLLGDMTRLSLATGVGGDSETEG